MKIIAKPYWMGKNYHEQILLFKENDLTPWALVHIDFFWEGDKRENSIYNRLYKNGETIIFEFKEVTS